jgi:hypothetical protein
LNPFYFSKANPSYCVVLVIMALPGKAASSEAMHCDEGKDAVLLIGGPQEKLRKSGNAGDSDAVHDALAVAPTAGK